ncbi:MAG: hypothetical protein GXY60_12635 [Spirochaetales bacterium]|nr:hypothetical protein [Spirochaetales bacterium]
MKKLLFLCLLTAVFLFPVSPSAAGPMAEKMRHLLKDLPGWEGMELVPIVTADSGQGRAAVFTREYQQGRTLVVQALKKPGNSGGNDDFEETAVDISSERMRQGTIDGMRYAELVYRVSPRKSSTGSHSLCLYASLQSFRQCSRNDRVHPEFNFG